MKWKDCLRSITAAVNQLLESCLLFYLCCNSDNLTVETERYKQPQRTTPHRTIPYHNYHTMKECSFCTKTQTSWDHFQYIYTYYNDRLSSRWTRPSCKFISCLKCRENWARIVVIRDSSPVAAAVMLLSSRNAGKKAKRHRAARTENGPTIYGVLFQHYWVVIQNRDIYQ